MSLKGCTTQAYTYASGFYAGECQFHDTSQVKRDIVSYSVAFHDKQRVLMIYSNPRRFPWENSEKEEKDHLKYRKNDFNVTTTNNDYIITVMISKYGLHYH